MFWNNFVSCCNQKGVAPNVAAAAVGVKSSGTVTGWKNGATPRQSVLKKLSDYFGVSTRFLLYGDNPMIATDGPYIRWEDIIVPEIGEKKAPDQEAEDYTEQQKEAIKFVMSLPDEQLRQFIKVGRAMYGDNKDD